MLRRIRTHHRFMLRYTRDLFKGFLRPAALFLSFMALTAIMIFSTLLYWIESGENAKIATYFDAFYFTVTTMTSVGLGDIHPITVSGKILSMMMMIGGTGIFVSFTALVASTLIEIEQDHRNRSSKDF